MIKSIVFFANAYPYSFSNAGVFIQQIVFAFADKGIKCIVIVPASITNAIIRKRRIRPKYEIQVSPNGSSVEIISPYYISFSSKKIGFINTERLNLFFFKAACIKVFDRLNLIPDLLYGHFIGLAGISSAIIGEKYGIKSIIGYGEGQFDALKYYPLNKLRAWLRNVSLFVPNSSPGLQTLLKYNIATEDNTLCLPNSVNTKLFCIGDKKKAREKLQIPIDDFIVLFVGSFIETKGPLRVEKATQGIEGVKCIYLGEGPQRPSSDNILFVGSVPHDKIPTYMQAADVFVLPTTREGCCNAIIEATCCGLPIISSNQAFNDAIMFNDNSIRINPLDVSEIRKAILFFKNDKSRLAAYSLASASHRNQFEIEERINKILSFYQVES